MDFAYEWAEIPFEFQFGEKRRNQNTEGMIFRCSVEEYSISWINKLIIWVIRAYIACAFIYPKTYFHR